MKTILLLILLSIPFVVSAEECPLEEVLIREVKRELMVLEVEKITEQIKELKRR